MTLLHISYILRMWISEQSAKWQDYSNSSALAMEILQSCTKPSTCRTSQETFVLVYIFHMASLAQRMSHCEQKHLKIWVKLTLFANPGMQLPNIPHCFIQNRNLHISDQNGALWVIEQVHSGICVDVAPPMEGTLHFGLEYYNLTQSGTALF